MLKNGTLASPAMARASSVLPVPGGPTSSAPFGILPPRRWKRAGSFRKSTISCSSSRASSMPATSSKVTRPSLATSSLARDLAEAHGAAAGAVLHLAHHEDPDADHQDERQRVEEQLRDQRAAFLGLGIETHVLDAQPLDELVVAGVEGAEILVRRGLADDFGAADLDRTDRRLRRPWSGNPNRPWRCRWPRCATGPA